MPPLPSTGGSTWRCIPQALPSSCVPSLLRVLVRPNYHAILESLRAGADDSNTPAHYPTKYHELLARGRLCELFELPCDNPCPLATKVAMQYQQLKLKHQEFTTNLEALEKGYSVLVTPRSRELCGLTREIMEAQRKQLGDRVYYSIEPLLWSKIWTRLTKQRIQRRPAADKTRETPPDEKFLLEIISKRFVCRWCRMVRVSREDDFRYYQG